MDLDEKYAEFAALFSDDGEHEDRQRVKGHRRARRERREAALAAKQARESQDD